MQLTEVALYHRTIRASITSVWDNVLDWQHLPWLHRTTFHDIDAIDAGPWGWTARIELQPGGPDLRFTVDLRIERPASRYVARTTEGQGAGSEIWTTLTPTTDTETDIEVRFLVPDCPPALVETLRESYLTTYRQLWDEDEAMMVRREAHLANAGATPSDVGEPVDLGRLETVRARLPLLVEMAGRTYRVVEVEGALVAHATVCPHMLGPLENAPLEGDCVRCPWHGYLFDVRTGRQADGERLRLAPAPRVEIDPVSTDVRLGFS